MNRKDLNNRWAEKKDNNFPLSIHGIVKAYMQWVIKAHAAACYQDPWIKIASVLPALLPLDRSQGLLFMKWEGGKWEASSDKVNNVIFVIHKTYEFIIILYRKNKISFLL